MATPFIQFTIAWLIGIWLASGIAVPSVALGFVTVVAFAGIIIFWRTPKPRWIFILTLAAILGALRFNLAQPHFDQATLATYNDQQKGDRIRAEGKLQTPANTGDFDYREYLARQGVYSIMSRPPPRTASLTSHRHLAGR